ncbi:amidase family protein [Corynebacterium sp. CCM 8835]|uniref:Amidase domain-containing protein n=1 Tax=Corynebacterium antarcticum TaxID=2800405 RepID=A0ABS1FJZ4_9CORY|nr:amidase family protein [Corynebacterium antarcticum]MCK7641596.1 amidase family protein [Corynebacterium antarcticum]MCK7660306.1 amidase family protein [Corynebacterium antarcticum]MCL0244824.1 amidase family protein [Corynebacterium antarcticum]MCX7491197.1 amidase family protein [Corynebacterium antarcticum]
MRTITRFVTALVAIGVIAVSGVITYNTLSSRDGSLQRHADGDFTLDEEVNTYAGQTEIDYAPYDGILSDLSPERRHQISVAFEGRDLVGRAQARRELGVTNTEALAYYVANMRESNSYYRSVLQLDPDAIAAAAELDARGVGPSPDQPLRGAVVLVKGNIAVKGLPNDAGSRALHSAEADADSSVVEGLRAAGAIVAGRTNLSELANFLTFDAPNGFSAVGGQALDARDPLNRDPSGSSTGSATAIALDYADLTFGTETQGSVISPAVAAGVYGAKAGYGECDISGIVPIDDRVDSPGVFGRSTADLAVGFRAACGIDPVRATDAGLTVIDMGLDPVLVAALGRARITVVEPGTELQQTIGELRDLPFIDALVAGVGPSMETYFSGNPSGRLENLHDLVEFYRQHPEAAPYGIDLIEQGLTTGMSLSESGEVLDRGRDLVDKINELMAEQGAVALVGRADGLPEITAGGSARATVPLIPVTQNLAVDVYGKYAVTIEAADGDTAALLEIARRVEAARPFDG